MSTKRTGLRFLGLGNAIGERAAGGGFGRLLGGHDGI